ncbi:MAG: hypothetical protein ACT4P4_17335 [Betaproteobacteria bacterium]
MSDITFSSGATGAASWRVAMMSAFNLILDSMDNAAADAYAHSALTASLSPRRGSYTASWNQTASSTSAGCSASPATSPSFARHSSRCCSVWYLRCGSL